MTIFLVPNLKKDPQLKVTANAAKLLIAQKAEVVMPVACQEVCRLSGVLYLPDSAAYARADLVVTVGGDGTILHTARGCIANDLPILGINVGRMGFLATCEVEELDKRMGQLVQGEYFYDSRSLLQARTMGSVHWGANALNDIVLYNGNRLQAMEFSVYCDGILVGRYSSDGVIVATPTGSTAYALSAGGPILDSRTQGFVVKAICAHSLRNPPIVFSSDRTILIQIAPREGDVVYVSSDGAQQQQLAWDSAVEIRLSEQKLKLISFSCAEQFKAIDKKLMGRQ